MRSVRIVFMGTPDFAVGVLDGILKGGYEMAGVITAPDKPAGRGRKLRASAVKTYALANGLPVLQPEKLRDPDFLGALEAWQANIFVVVAFRMLPEVVWKMPEYGTFNLHASLLPNYRGAAPINWAIINGEEKTGVTTFFIDEQIDTGAMIASSSTEIAQDETAGSLHDRLMILGRELTLETLELIASNKVKPETQSMDGTQKEAPKLHARNTKIDWSAGGEQIDRLIRGLSPYPAAWCYLINDQEELKVKIYNSRFEQTDHDGRLGLLQHSKNRLWVQVEGGQIEILELQLPGKKRMAVRDLLNGLELHPESKFA